MCHFLTNRKGSLKWYYDENRIFTIRAIWKHKKEVCMRRKMLFTIFKYLFSFQRYSSFWNMQICQLMTSYTRYVVRYLSQFVSEMFDSLQQDSTKCAPQYELNSFVTMVTYWLPDLPNI